MAHVHSVDPWPFTDEVDTAAFTCKHVLEDGRDVLHVVHDLDGAWQFLCGDENHEYESARVVCLACAVSRDVQGLPALADLPLGWVADRDALGESWNRSPHPGYEEEDDEDEESA